MTLLRASILLSLLTPLVASAQMPTPLPNRGATPLLHVRFNGPAGMKASFFQGRAPARTFPAPVAVGLRPGYCYRVRLDGFADRPGLSLYPMLEVRGSLCLQPRFSAAGFPATVDITPADIDAAIDGKLITKVIYLEHPDRAEPKATVPGQILETEMPTNADMLADARLRGRVIIVLRMGERIPTDQELIYGNVPGTILFPGQRVVGPAYAPPSFLGGGRCGDEECLRDGGDRLTPAGFDAEGNLAGLDPEDTIAEYTDSRGRRSLACSNRVCLTVPRFAALRNELPLAKTESVIPFADRTLVKRGLKVEAIQPNLTAKQTEATSGYHSKMRPSQNVANLSPGLFLKLQILQAHQLDLGPIEALCTKKVLTLSPVLKAKLLRQLELTRSLSVVSKVAGTEASIGTAVVARAENGPELFTATMTTRDLTVCCNEAPIPPEKPLVVVKCADRGAAQVGDVVTFSIRYSNVGGRAMTDVAVSDSLSPRLEYVEGSAEADRDAVFTIQPNEAGSSVLRWEISGRLLPGQSGRVRFKVRVR